MKKHYLLLFLLLLFPLNVHAKTVTCTTAIGLTEGQEVGDGFNAKCSEGTVNPFAVYTESGGPITSDTLAVANQKYYFQFEWIGTFDEETDKIIVDGIDRTEFAGYGGCDTGCMVHGKAITAKANPNTATTTTKKADTDTTTTTTTTTTQQVESTKVYWVSFDVNGGKEEIKQQAVEKGKTATKPENPTKEGYIFDCWLLHDKEYDFNTKITGSIILKAKWKEVTTGKENVPFIRLTGILAPYEGDKLDNDLRIETFKSWDISIFNVGIEWYRGKTKDKIDERVYNLGTATAEEGYYYQIKFVLTPGEGYTLNNTKVYLTGKRMATTKEDNTLVFYSQVYGPIKKGESAEPLLILEDYEATIGSGKMTETQYSVNGLIRDHDNDAESILLGPNCIRVTNTDRFSISTNICGTNEINHNISGSSIFGLGSNVVYLTMKEGTFQAGQEISTDIILTDTKGRNYTATYVFKVVKMKKQKVGQNGDPIIAEFLGEVEKNWAVRIENLTGTDVGRIAHDNLSIAGFEFVALENIKVFDEDGEKRNGEFTIKILLNEELKKYKDFSFVYTFGGDGYKMGQSSEIIKGHIEGDYLVARLPHLSNYAIFGSTEAPKAETPNYFLYIGIAIGIALGTILIAVVVYFIIKKKKK